MEMINHVRIRKTIICSILFAYPICLMFSDSTMFFTGIFLIVMVLASLHQWDLKKVLLILSPIFTYPLFLYTIFNLNFGIRLPFHWISNITLYIFIYSVFYGFLLKDLWFWIVLSVKKFFIIGTLIFMIVIPVIGKLPADCFYISNAEKGVEYREIAICKFFNLYEPTGAAISGKFSGLAEASGVIATAGPKYIALFMLIGFLYHYVKVKTSNSSFD